MGNIKTKVRIGVPTVHSRLHPKVMNILGLNALTNPKLLSFYTNNADIYLLRGWDLPYAVKSERLDYAFCGKDTIMENNTKVKILKEFKNMASPIALCMKTNRKLNDTKTVVIATEYPILTKRYLKGRFGKLEVVRVHGATEAFGCLDRIDGIVDIVESGDTLRSNGLEIATELFETYPCLISRKGIEECKGAKEWIFCCIREAFVAKTKV